MTEFCSKRVQSGDIGVVGCPASDQNVVSTAAVDRIQSEPADQDITSGLSVKSVVAGLPDQHIGT